MAPKNCAELHRLKTVERPNVIAAIAEARSHGDLSENAEYDAAKERQGFVEGRIQEVEGKLSNAQIIDPKLLDADGRCVFGATSIEDQDTGDPVTYQIVGEDEADIKAGQDLDRLADGARADRQVCWRYRPGAGAGWYCASTKSSTFATNNLRGALSHCHYPLGWRTVGDRLHCCAGSLYSAWVIANLLAWWPASCLRLSAGSV
jgi:transcription elongation GreA/GreB family factor